MPNWIVDLLGSFMNGLALIALAIWAAVFSPREQQKKPNRLHIFILWILAILIIASLVFQILSAFRHYSYDTELARYYEDNRFESSRMIEHRKQAAAALKEYLSSTNKNWETLTNGTDDLDYVLGFFDELGYDQQHGRISADVIHEYFYADIVGYYQGAAQYIAYSQKSDSTTDFSYVKLLFDSVREVESRKTRQPISALDWTDKELADYLKSEISLKESK